MFGVLPDICPFCLPEESCNEESWWNLVEVCEDDDGGYYSCDFWDDEIECNLNDDCWWYNAECYDLPDGCAEEECDCELFETEYLCDYWSGLLGCSWNGDVEFCEWAYPTCLDDCEGIDYWADISPNDEGTNFCNWILGTDMSCANDCEDEEVTCFLVEAFDTCSDCLEDQTCDDQSLWDNIDCICNDGDENMEGDINYDGEVNVVDIVNLVNAILDDYEYDCNADLYFDGSINVVDVVNLVNLILYSSEVNDCDSYDHCYWDVNAQWCYSDDCGQYTSSGESGCNTYGHCSWDVNAQWCYSHDCGQYGNDQ